MKGRTVIGVLAIVAATAIILLSMGREPICRCGYVKLWHGVAVSPETSQHIADWYTPSHVVHGFLFYGLLVLLARRWPIGARLIAATLLESGWEILENTPLVIDRYREGTIALDYYGDSVLNSMCDIGWMMAGFTLAARLPLPASILLIVAAEAGGAYFIRDNLSLNILMLIYPLEAVRRWQAG
ncbi:MAG: DUF2585 domain-containing protein [Cyanobacteria bacterium]|nr:DUF2585 domain-containing protein [Cyanobacteriota bacterium]